MSKWEHDAIYVGGIVRGTTRGLMTMILWADVDGRWKITSGDGSHRDNGNVELEDSREATMRSAQAACEGAALRRLNMDIADLSTTITITIPEPTEEQKAHCEIGPITMTVERKMGLDRVIVDGQVIAEEVK